MSDPKTILFFALATFGAAVLGILTKLVAAMADAWLKKIGSEETAHQVGLVRDEISIVVDMIEQTLRPEVAAAMEDGEIDKSELVHLRDTALSEVKKRFGKDFWDRLFAALGVPPGGRDAWLVATIEAFVRRAKPSA